MTDEFFVRIKKQNLVLVLGLVGIAATLSIAAVLAFPVQTALSDHQPDDVDCDTTPCVHSVDIVNRQVKSNDIAVGVKLLGSVCIDKPTICVDGPNNRVGIGTDAPADPLHLMTTLPVVAKFETSSNLARLAIASNGADPNAGIRLEAPSGTLRWSMATLQAAGTGAAREFILSNDQGGGPVFLVDGNSNLLQMETDVIFDGDGFDNDARLIFEPGLLTVNSNGVAEPAFLLLNQDHHERVFLKINCQDPNGCDISLGGAAPIAGQLLILQNANTSLECAVAPGFVRVQDTTNNDLGATRVLDNRSDKLMLIYDGNAWTELAFANNGQFGVC